MLIEKICYNEELLFVGVGELRNKASKDKDDLISLSSSLSNDTTVVQFLSPNLIAGTMHLLSAVQNAINAVRGKYAISRSLNIEIIVYASAQRQIERAFEKMGVVNDLQTVGVIIIDEKEDSIQECFEQLFKKLGSDIEPAFCYDKTQLDRIMKAFDVSDIELRTFTDSDDLDELKDALVRCIVNRVSMVALDA